MSIYISSDDEKSSTSDLPPIGFLNPATEEPSRPSSSTVDLYDNDKEDRDDICVDLTQEIVEDNYCEPIVLSGSSARSIEEWDHGGKAIGRPRLSSIQSDSTVELADPDPDAAFDQLLPTASLKHLESRVSLLSGSSAAGSTSSGYGSGAISDRRKSADSASEKPKRKNTSADRATKRQRLEGERLAKLAANEANKIYRPAECMKYMQIEVHPSLQQAWYMADVQREASCAGARLVPTADICDEDLLLWSRRVERRLAAPQGQMELTDAKEPCKRALLVQRAEQIAPYVRAHTLASRVAQARDMAGCRLTLVVFGAKDYFKSSGRKKKPDGTMMTEIEMEMAFTDLLVTADCDSVVVNTASELALLIVQFTKAIAEAPHKLAKKACDEQADFYMRGDNKKCVPVDKDGHGLSRLWQQMVAVLPHSSLEVARAVCGVYKSPLTLYEALQKPNAVNELADVGVDRAGLPGCKTRRLGPEFARKLHTLFTASDGNMLIE